MSNSGRLFNSGNAELSSLWLRNPEQAALQCKVAYLTEGTITGAAKKLGVSRETFASWTRKHPEILER